jgi:hypothetical protein
MNTKAMTAHLRNRIKVAGLRNARVRMAPGTAGVVQVFPAGNADARFSDEEQVAIAHIARCNGLTGVRGLPILDNGTHGAGFTLDMPR